MSYTTFFPAADKVITHLAGVVAATDDQDLIGQYTGFAAVSAVTIYELAIKTVFIEFAERKHAVFENFVGAYFDRINGRITLRDLCKDYVPRFGEKYAKRFTRVLDEEEKRRLIAQGISIRSSYGNLISWRHEFAHEGRVPTNATFAEVRSAYQNGKVVIDCLATTMVR